MIIKQFLLTVTLDERTRMQLDDVQLAENLETVAAHFMETWSTGPVPDVKVRAPQNRATIEAFIDSKLNG